MASAFCPSCSSTPRAQRQAFGLPNIVFFGPRDLNQIGRDRQRRVGVTGRQLDLVKQIRPLPVQFRLERLRVQRFQNRRRAGKIAFARISPAPAAIVRAQPVHSPDPSAPRAETRCWSAPATTPPAATRWSAPAPPPPPPRRGAGTMIRENPRQRNKGFRRRRKISALKLRFANPINVLVGEIPGPGFARGEQRDGLLKFSLLEFRLRLHQHRLGHAVGFRVFLDELCELRFRAVPHPVLKRAHGGGIGAVFPRGWRRNSRSPPRNSASKIKSHCQRNAMRPNLNDVARRQKREIRRRGAYLLNRKFVRS